jgi:hypothetical protein
LFLSGGFHVHGSFSFSIRIAQTSCVHTPLPFHFFLPTLRQHLDSGGHSSIMAERKAPLYSPFLCTKKDVSHLGWVAHKSVDQFWRFEGLPLILLRHFLHPAGYHRL